MFTATLVICIRSFSAIYHWIYGWIEWGGGEKEISGSMISNVSEMAMNYVIHETFCNDTYHTSMCIRRQCLSK